MFSHKKYFSGVKICFEKLKQFKKKKIRKPCLAKGLHLEDVAHLGEDERGEAGQQRDALQEVNLKQKRNFGILDLILRISFPGIDCGFLFLDLIVDFFSWI